MTKLCAALAMAAVVLAFAIAGGEAGAHSEQGLLALTAEAAADARVVLLVATLKYANDGEGRDRGELVLPSDGKWDVTVRSEDPVASARASVTVKTRHAVVEAPASAG